MSEPWLVVGLGNPGPRYERTRHNVGHLVVDELARRRDGVFRLHKAGAQVAETWLRPGGAKLILAKPTSFMNVSGRPVAALARFFSVSPAQTVIVHDELDIPFDTLRLKVGGGHGGHNGVRDVAQVLGTADFPRVRVGIGRPPGRQDAADWVLEAFPASDRETLALAVSDAADAVERLIDDGLIAAQQVHHAPRA